MTDKSMRTQQIKSGAWETTKGYIKNAAEGFTEYYKDKYKGTSGIGNALSRTGEILDEGFDIMDNGNPLTYVKKPIKNLAKKFDEKISDGNPAIMTKKEKAWNGIKGAGSVADKLTSSKGIIYGCLVAGTMGAGIAALPAVGKAVAGVVLNAISTVSGSVLVAKGTYDVVKAETEQEAQKGGAEIGAGSLMLGASAATAKSTLAAARNEGLHVPTFREIENMSTIQAMYENVKLTPRVIAQATGIYTPPPFSTVIHAGSPELRNTVDVYESCGTNIQEKKFYRFNPNGSEADILKNNPGVIKTSDGQYAIKLDGYNEPRFQIIDPTKEQMICIGEEGAPYEVVSGEVFKQRYVEPEAFSEYGNLIPIEPENLKYGEVITAKPVLTATRVGSEPRILRPYGGDGARPCIKTKIPATAEIRYPDGSIHEFGRVKGTFFGEYYDSATEYTPFERRLYIDSKGNPYIDSALGEPSSISGTTVTSKTYDLVNAVASGQKLTPQMLSEATDLSVYLPKARVYHTNGLLMKGGRPYTGILAYRPQPAELEIQFYKNGELLNYEISK